jgi:drug/metabolite transporter (DMT)-like permease
MTSTASLYALTVLIWGTTWIGIKYQLGVVDPGLSIAYRFAIASLVLFTWCRWRRLPLRFPAAVHARFLQLGLLLFCGNYVLVYSASAALTSGLVALVFSTLPLWAMLNGALFMRLPLNARVASGSLLGVAGIALVFWPEFDALRLADTQLHGLLLALCGTVVASLGTLTSLRNQRHGVPVVQTNAWAMAYGTLLLLAWAFGRGAELAFDTSPGYLLSLLYLALPGTVIGFSTYLTLVGRLGADRAAYAMVLFPLVALTISTFFEGYAWAPAAVAGVALVMAGNVLVLYRHRRRGDRQQTPAGLP